MNRKTTKILGTIVTIGSIILVVTFGFGGFILASISRIIGKDITFDGFGAFVIIPFGCIGVFAFIILTVVLGFRKDSHRREDLQKLAQQMGWVYTKETVLPFLNELDSYLNNSWDSNALTGSSNNVITGRINSRNVVVSDQIYSTGSGKNRTTHQKTLIGIELPEVHLPLMSLYPEGFMDKVFDTFSKFDIDFENHPHFSQKYILYGKNVQEIRSFFTNEILHFYEQQAPFTTVCGGKYLVIYNDNLLEPHEIMARISFISNLAEFFLKK